MQKILLSLIMLFFSHVSFAGWVHITHAGNYIYYGDPSSIEISGYKVRMLILEDVASSKKSEVSLEEFDCKNKSINVLVTASFSENMARGKMDSIDKQVMDLGVQPSNTIGGAKHEFACKRANFNF
jgi:hypothetical protein